VPARHAAPIRPPDRRTWLVLGLLVALTALPMLVVVLAGRSLVRAPSTPPAPYQAVAPDQPVIVESDRGGTVRPPRAGEPAVPAQSPPPEPAGEQGREERADDDCPPAGGAGGGASLPPSGGASPTPLPPSSSPSSSGQPSPSVGVRPKASEPPGGRFHDRVFGELDLPH
jgi:hypothetical protein